MILNRMWKLDLQTQQRLFGFTEIKHRYEKYYDLKTLHKFSKLFKKYCDEVSFGNFYFTYFLIQITAIPAQKMMFLLELIFLGILPHYREKVMNDMGII